MAINHRSVILILCLASHAVAGDDPPFSADGLNSGEPAGGSPILPAGGSPILPIGGETEIEPGQTVDWNGLMRQSLFFLSVEHSFRLATEHGTRNPGSAVFPGYIQSLRNLHGWSDGDPFYVNYVGHPMQGAVAGYIWTHNDRRYRSVSFGMDKRYWKSRLRAAGFSWAYSTQFEIGPLSEGTIGNIQARYPQQGLVDHVVTPVFGLGWMVAEDFLDKYLLIPLERRVQNRVVRALTRGFLNPSRSMANMMRGQVPFQRDGRSIFASPEAISSIRSSIESGPPEEEPGEDIGPAPFELTAMSNQRILNGDSRGACVVGGGAEAAFRMSRDWQLVAEVSGCRLGNLPQNTTGDALSYLIGPRWTPSERRLRPYVQLLAGGLKLTTEEVSPDLRDRLEAAAQEKGLPPPRREQYATTAVAHGFAMSTGAGVDLKLARAAAVKLASISWTKAWTGNASGLEYNRGLELKLGVTLRMGTW